MQNKFVFILGTRPEIIKLSPLIRTCITHNIPYTLIHTGQHYSYELSDLIFQDLNLPKPDYNLGIGSAPHGEQTGKMLIALEPILRKEKPSAVIVLGDPNSAFAGALRHSSRRAQWPRAARCSCPRHLSSSPPSGRTRTKAPA